MFKNVFNKRNKIILISAAALAVAVIAVVILRVNTAKDEPAETGISPERLAITIDPNHEDSITYNKKVVDLSESTNPITYNDATAMSIIISGSDASVLESGSVYLLPPSREYPFGVARKVKSITQDGNDYLIENTEPQIEEVLDAIDFQGEYYPDYSKIEWAEGVTGEFIPDTLLTPTSFSSDITTGTMSVQPLGNLIKPMVKTDTPITGTLIYKFGEDEDGEDEEDGEDDGDDSLISVSGSLRLKATAVLDANFKAGKIEYAALSIEQTITTTHEFSQEGEKNYPLFKVPVPIPIPASPLGVGIVLKGEINTSGEFVMTLTQEITDEYGFIIVDNEMSVLDTKPTYDIEAEVAANAKVTFALLPTLQIWGLDAADVGVHIGVAADANIIIHNNCTNVDIYVPLSVSASLFPKSKKFEKSVEYEIWTADTSPFRFNLHYEDGASVEDCTKEEGAEQQDADLKSFSPEDIYGKYIAPRGDITVSEYIPYIRFLNDNSCQMLINYYEGVELVNGTYSVEDNRIFVSLALKGTIFENSSSVERAYIFDVVNADHIVIDRQVMGVAAGNMFTKQETSAPENNITSDSVSNTGGNIVNEGHAALQEDWIYYSNSHSELKKIKVDGTDDRLVYPDSSCYINVVGDWIYYLNNHEGALLYKIKTDGTERQQIGTDRAYFINVVDDWIFYSDEKAIYKIKTDGTERHLVCSDAPESINVVGDWVFYGNKSDGGSIYKIRTDGTERQSICSDAARFINVVGDWIYYRNEDDGGAIYRIKSNGTEKQHIYSDKAYSLNVVGGWIYYTSGNNNAVLSKVTTTGTDWQTVGTDGADNINVAGDWIYYQGAGFQFYKIKTNGTERQTIAQS